MTAQAELIRSYRRAFRPPQRLSVSDWAETNLTLSPKVTNYAGPIRLDLAPYLRGIFDAFRDPSIERIALCFGAQTAKTTAELVCLTYTLDQDPGPALWVMPSIELARDFSDQRLKPLVSDSAVLAAEMPADDDDFKKLAMQFRRANLNLVGANSPGNLSSRPIRYLFADEIDKYPAESTREGSALNLAIRRTAAYWNRKIVLSSTPTLEDGQIWGELLAADWRQFWVPCPHCGEMQVLIFPNIRIPEGLRDPDKIRDTAWYECAHCCEKIQNSHKHAMLRRGEWRPRAERMDEYDWNPPAPGGSRASFHLPSWYSIWVSFGDVLARFIEAKPHPDILREIINSDFAEPWQERGAAKAESDILAHRSEYPEAQPPADAKIYAVTQTVDVQQDHLYYTVRAWGPSEESWLLEYGILPDFAAVAHTLERQYGGHRSCLCLVDSGYRTEEVYEFCRRHAPLTLAIKGEDRQAAPLRWSSVDRKPGSGEHLPGGLRLLTIHATHFKGALHGKLSINRGDLGYWHVHADTGEDYARQLVAEILVERKDKRGRLHREWRQVRRDNHYLDLECYQLAAARVLRQLGKLHAPSSSRPKRKNGEHDSLLPAGARDRLKTWTRGQRRTAKWGHQPS